VTKAFRGSGGLVSSILAAIVIHAHNKGYKYVSSCFVDPRGMFQMLKHGGKLLAEVFYDEPGYPFTLSEEELLKMDHITRMFPNGRPCVQFILTELETSEAL
jgi:hypothetical protein